MKFIEVQKMLSKDLFITPSGHKIKIRRWVKLSRFPTEFITTRMKKVFTYSLTLDITFLLTNKVKKCFFFYCLWLPIRSFHDIVRIVRSSEKKKFLGLVRLMSFLRSNIVNFRSYLTIISRVSSKRHNTIPTRLSWSVVV